MTDMTALGQAILNHWRAHRPQMVKELEKSGRLMETVLETQEMSGDLLYELVSVKRMDYQAAWELAAQEWMLPDPPSPEQLRRGKRKAGGRKNNSSKGSQQYRRRGISG